jgi:hypothetical protein
MNSINKFKKTINISSIVVISRLSIANNCAVDAVASVSARETLIAEVVIDGNAIEKKESNLIRHQARKPLYLLYPEYASCGE